MSSFLFLFLFRTVHYNFALIVRLDWTLFGWAAPVIIVTGATTASAIDADPAPGDGAINTRNGFTRISLVVGRDVATGAAARSGAIPAAVAGVFQAVIYLLCLLRS
jgi:hypothetical protein